MKKENIKNLIEKEFQRFKIELTEKIENLTSENDTVMRNHMDVSEVSQLMNLSKKTVRKYASDDKLPSEKDAAGRLRFKKEDVANFIRNIQTKKYGI